MQWTCVHDIQTLPEKDEEKEKKEEEADTSCAACRTVQAGSWTSGEESRTCRGADSAQAGLRDSQSGTSTRSGTQAWSTAVPTPSEQGSSEHFHTSSPSFVLSVSTVESSSSSPTLSPDVRAPAMSSQDDLECESSRSLGVSDLPSSGSVQADGASPSDSLSAQPSTSNLLSVAIPSMRSLSPRERLRQSVTFIIRSNSQISERTWMMMRQNKQDIDQSGQKIIENKSRLIHFVEEPNIGRGFIKEVCFSSDGRLVCSPFGFGIRLMAFNPSCGELCDCIPEQPQQLYEVVSNMSHTAPVLTTKFSPTHCLLVSGCLNGKVDFHQPKL